jgi:hypothetical protein
MDVYGELDGFAAQVRTEWGEGGLAQATVLTLRADSPLRDPGEASGMVESLEQDGAALRVEGREVTLRLAEVVLDPLPLPDRLESLRKLCLHLRPQVGPYR